ncbi:MAG: lipoyl domain-containing protein [Armatimonadota bacterium]|nr:lipoyl domain-containing protein [Armatimonadota bacterium]MDR7448298.1 lipoyl domain-containing protein [Armatimonadota bacterium]MDR7458327.1 lipoyl domain-containing protein [Armatimonadota bacterium]MDR7478370.1 lipoyl domain-containing protein [Armatimonadota bacterium]MDR7487304.1 lipoyl domain-containing protein [Armatimonadota bacterium]
MVETVRMPKWGLTMAEGRIVEWMVDEDEPVTEGDVLCIVETEKTNVELPAPCAGVVARILVREGHTVTVGTPIAVIASTPEEAMRVRSGER